MKMYILSISLGLSIIPAVGLLILVFIIAYEKDNFSAAYGYLVALITVRSVLGNIFHDRRLLDKCQRMKAANKCESLPLSRAEIERIRLRRKTDRGTDMGLVLEPGSRLEHGDVLVNSNEKFIVVEQLPEKVVTVIIKEKDAGRIAQLSALVGHAIGNRHRPIAVSDGIISFPLMTALELEVFKKILPEGNIELKIEEKIFQPSGGAIHEH